MVATMNASMTDLAIGEIETDKTYAFDNHAFLRAVFGADLSINKPIVVSFPGNPTNAPSRSWYGQVWLDGHSSLPADENNYFSLASFVPDETGRYRRKKTSFKALHAMMLDDLGSKVSMERVTLPPSWLLETSPGNYQAGYILSEPLTDGLLADKLMNAIVAANLCDPGANGPRARAGRDTL